GRGDLDDLGADDVESLQSADRVEQLAAGHSACLRGAGAGGGRGIEDIDVDGQIDGGVAESGAHPGDDIGHGRELVLVAADDLEAEDLVVLEVLLPVEGSADADVHAGLEIEQTPFAGAAERGAVRVRGTEVGVPGVEVGIEVEDGDLPVRLVQ